MRLRLSEFYARSSFGPLVFTSKANSTWGFGYQNFMQGPPSSYWFSPRSKFYMEPRLSKSYAGPIFGLLVFTPKQVRLYIEMAMPWSYGILFDLWYRLIAVNLWNSHHRRRWDSSEGWTLIVRPTLLSLLIAIAFIHSSHTAIFASCCIALHRNGELKMPRLKRKVLSRTMPKARIWPTRAKESEAS